MIIGSKTSKLNKNIDYDDYACAQDEINKSIIMGDEYIYTYYANAFAKGNETTSKIYFKHIMAESSPLGLKNYKENIDKLFNPIILKNKKIGMTICAECNHSAFSRVYGKQNIDMIINATGDNVNYDKWYRYNKVRAIENNCFNFCTMGYNLEKKRNGVYSFGFTPNGKSIKENKTIFPFNHDNDKIGNVFIYDDKNIKSSCKKDLKQKETSNKPGNMNINPDKIESLLNSSTKIDNDLFLKKYNEFNIILAVLTDNDIINPEKTLKLIYNKKLKKFKNKKYLLINTWNHLDKKYYENTLSEILRVRSMENYCTVLLLSNEFQKCYQTGKNRTSQLILREKSEYGLDLKRMTGPEVIWKNKNGIKKSWRKNFEKLIEYISTY